MSDARREIAQLSALTLAMLGGLVLVLVSGFVVLTITDHETSGFVLFVAGPLVTTVVGALLGQKVREVEETVKVVEQQTNGLLSAKLEDLHTHLSEQTRELSVDPGAPSDRLYTHGPDARLPAQAPPIAAEQHR